MVREPKSMWGLTGWIFLGLGALFLLCGILTRAGIMKTKSGSQGDTSVGFLILGGALMAAGIFLLFAAMLKEKRRRSLLQSGTPVTGEVVSVKQLPFTRWGTSYPYVVRFRYESDGISYRGKSCLLWALPKVQENDGVTVRVDADHPKRCAVEL